MAGVRFTATTGVVSLAAATKTLLQIKAPTNQRVFINEWEVSFQGVDASQPPVLIQLVRQSDAGTGSSSVTLVKVNASDDVTLQSTAIKTPTAEPTTSDIIDEKFISPNGGGFTWGPGNIGVLIAKGGERLGVRLVNAGTSVNCIVTAKCEE